MSALHQKTWTRGGLHLRDVTFEVPFDHFGQGAAKSAAASLAAPAEAHPTGPKNIEIFARITATEADSTQPYLVFLQGGPGVEAPPPPPPRGQYPRLSPAHEGVQGV
ncbi:MAG: aminopeptidase, partial [Brevibacterium sp.]|nr:aminopeptidase [Brevibacterium sp.]